MQITHHYLFFSYTILLLLQFFIFFFFFFNDTATTEIYTLSLHDALPISISSRGRTRGRAVSGTLWAMSASPPVQRSEEHTSELQSRPHLVCRLLLEKKKKKKQKQSTKQQTIFY